MATNEQIFKTLSEEINEVTKTCVHNLETIWNAIGLDEETLSVNCKVVLDHVKGLCNDMVFEAEESKNMLVEKVQKLLSEANDLQKQLHVKIVTDKYENMPLDKLERVLKEDMKIFQSQLEERKQKIKKLQEQEQKVCKKIGIKSKLLSLTPIASLDDISEFEERIKTLSEQQFQLEEKFMDTKTIITDIMEELGLQPETDLEKNVIFDTDISFCLSDDNMLRLEKLHTKLKTRLEETKNNVAELRQTVTMLWEQLGEDVTIRDEFLVRNPGITAETVRALEREIARCKEKRRANIKIFVDKMRQELVEWWNICRYGRDQRNQFLSFQSECYTEDLLTLHELEVQKLKRFYKSHERIFSTLNKRDELWQKMIELENSAKDPNRYKNRGGKLLLEEKERKTIANKLPRIEMELKTMIADSEKLTGNPFLIDGATIDDVIDNAWENYKRQKHSQLSVRKQARDQTVTPNKTRSRLTPSMCRTRVMPATVGAIGTKRKLVTPMTQSSSAAKKSRILSERNNREPMKTGAIKKTANILKKSARVSGACKRLDMSFRPKRSVSPSKRKRAKATQASSASTTSDYDLFEQNIENRRDDGWRSTTVHVTPMAVTAAGNTPAKEKKMQYLEVPFCSSSRTPQVPRTPRTPRSPRTPRRSPHLTAVSDLPIIF